MAKPGFWNDNSQRDYPFLLDRTGRADLAYGDLGKIPFSTVVDAGFLFGPTSGFVDGENTVWLSAVRRIDGTTIEFEFSTDAETLSSSPLTFSRSIAEAYAHDLAVVAAEAETCAGDFGWEGFLTTGDLTGLAEMIPDPGDFLLGDPDQALVEPAVIQNFARHYAVGVSVANTDRTRATNPEGCRELCWPVDPENIRVRERCLTGPIVFKEGYNIAIQEDEGGNRLIFTAAVGQGEGEPCEPVPYYAGEKPPKGRKTLEGAVSCGSTVRSLGGAVGPAVEVVAGGGVSVSFDPPESKIVVNFDLRDIVLAGAFDPNPPCEGSMSLDDADECSCGPA